MEQDLSFLDPQGHRVAAVLATPTGDTDRIAVLCHGFLCWRNSAPSGWFANNAFTPDRAPFTHTIAYAIRGFLECGVLANEERYLAAALKAARAVAKVERADGWLAGTYAENWTPEASYCCLTGVAQMSLNWTRLAQETGAVELLESARKAIAFVKRSQGVDDADPIVRGAVAGSLPIWGRYSMFQFPNWAAKFFADALMMDMADAPIPPVARHPASAEKVAAHV